MENPPGILSPCANVKTDENGGNNSSEGCSSSGDETSENQDEDSSSSLPTLDVENQLDSFRQQWQNEIINVAQNDNMRSKSFSCIRGHSSKSKSGSLDRKNQSVDSSIEEQAKLYFTQGINAEEAGLLYEAISYYRKAVQLVPDIEFRIYDPGVRTRDRNISQSSTEEGEITEVVIEEEEKEKDLIVRFNRFRQRISGLYCLPDFEQVSTHISDLPLELIMYIFKWVVSIDLDMKSLEQLSMVCRGFYICSRDEEIWRLACLRVWGVKCVKRSIGTTWRQMYIQSPHLRFNGCYISRTTYVRHGEASYIDDSYRPWYLVEYFRYLRFFPEGLVLMLTTPDNPYLALSKLRTRTPRFISVMVGHYRLRDNNVTAILKRPLKPSDSQNNNMYHRRRRQQNPDFYDAGEQSFHVEFEVEHVKKRPNFKIIWKRYAIHTVYLNGQKTVANFDLSPNNFPPFWFSVVRSYTAFTENPLA